MTRTMPTKNLTMCLLAAFASVLVGACGALSADAARPNIILVMTDDQGYGDLSCHGHPLLRTPNLDQLAEQSTRFTDFHASPTCAPTRAALMSGLAPFKVGVTHTILERDRMAHGVPTMADVLREAGYTTGVFGKWHLGDEDPYQPQSRGFDEVFIHGAGGIGQKFAGSQSDAPGTSYFDPIIKHNGRFEQTEGYCTDVFFRQALGWIKQQANAEDAKPFFVYLPTNAPHSPFIVDKKYSGRFKGKCSAKQASFFGMIENIDENMGRLMRKLDEWSLSENTLLIFMTDNGCSAGNRVYNAGMRGAKNSPHTGGSRVPLFLRLPGFMPAGQDVDRLARHYDLLPTLAELAGAEAPRSLDGRSLMPLIADPQAEWPDRYTFFHRGRWPKRGGPGRFGKGDSDPDSYKYQGFAVRNERWRLVEDQLYDIDNDPGETTDVAAEHPEVVAEMRAAYDAWWQEARPLMVNEDASLEVRKPFLEQFRAQEAGAGIPDWSPAPL